MRFTKYFPIRIFDDIFIISIYNWKCVIQIFAIDNNYISEVFFVNNNRHWLYIFSTKNMNLRSLSFLIEILSLLYNKYYAFSWVIIKHGTMFAWIMGTLFFREWPINRSANLFTGIMKYQTITSYYLYDLHLGYYHYACLMT